LIGLLEEFSVKIRKMVSNRYETAPIFQKYQRASHLLLARLLAEERVVRQFEELTKKGAELLTISSKEKVRSQRSWTKLSITGTYFKD
jgi:hypothetical protein